MPKIKRDAPEKERIYKFYGFNITIQGKSKNTPRYYYSLIYKIYSEDIFKSVGGERAMVLRLGFESKGEYKGKKSDIFSGTITRFTLLDGKKWLNRANKDFQDVEIPDGVYPNVYETEFVFVPDAHKFFVRQNAKLPPVAIAEFLKKALAEVIKKSEIANVSIIVAQDTIDTIISARELKRLEVEVSYTNDDIGDSAQELMDDMYKEAHIGNATNIFKPDGTGKIDATAKLVQGLLGLAKENGEAKASIIGANGKTKKIVTSHYPEKIPIKTSDWNNLHLALFNYVMKRWRSQNGTKRN